MVRSLLVFLVEESVRIMLTKADITAANAAPWLQKVQHQNTTSRQFVMNPPKAKNALTNPRQRNDVQKKEKNVRQISSPSTRP